MGEKETLRAMERKETVHSSITDVFKSVQHHLCA